MFFVFLGVITYRYDLNHAESLSSAVVGAASENAADISELNKVLMTKLDT